MSFAAQRCLLQVTASLIVDKDGTLLEFIGDEVMAIWNAPVPQEDHVFRAVTQALAIVKAFHQLALAPKKAKHILGGTKFPEVCFGIAVMLIVQALGGFRHLHMERSGCPVLLPVATFLRECMRVLRAACVS